MTSSKTTNQYNRQNWEQSDFPIVCETCLGDNSFLRMTKERFGKECKICGRPFTIFRWQPGSKARFKKTEVCQVCAKTKNVCQTCILDLEYGLPVQVRDNALRVSQTGLARGPVNREYGQQQLEQAMASSRDPTGAFGGLDMTTVGPGGGLVSAGAAAGGKMRATGGGSSDMLLKLARTEPYYRRNRPHICSFYVKGECKRGEECPFRHEKPTDPDDPLSNQNIKDRFYGLADPVAHKLLDKYRSMPQLAPPEDKSITTLYVGGLPETVGERELRDRFYQYGELRSVTVYPRQRCAFIQFATREAAERAADRSYDKLIMGGARLTLNWGKAQLTSSGVSTGIGTAFHHSHAVASGPGAGAGLGVPMIDVSGVPGLVMSFPLPPPALYQPHQHQFNAINSAPVIPPPPPPPISTTAVTAPGTSAGDSRLRPHYPSQDPNRFGTATNKF